MKSEMRPFRERPVHATVAASCPKVIEPSIRAICARFSAGCGWRTRPDPAALAAEREHLAALESRPLLARTGGYLRLIGPGYLQSAMTLGGGTAASALFAGAIFGYALLWVAPVAMIFGIIMLAAVSYQTLSTGERPFAAMSRYAGPFFAWGWALGALVASIIWHFPQYNLAAGVLVDMGSVAGIDGVPPWTMSLVVLAWAIALSFMYGGSPALIRWYERLLKYMVWGIVLCFGWVVIRTGVDDWGALFKGFIPFQIPAAKELPSGETIQGATLVISGLAAAVGINMVFLYPYSLLARGWGREHRRLARFDLWSGMFLPYLLAASLMTIATANTLYGEGFVGSRLAPVDAAKSLGDAIGVTSGRIIFNIGVLGMALSTITLHMLCSGFVCSELFGWKVGSWKYRLATLLPAVGVLGPVWWGKMAIWLAVPTNIVCGFFLPIAYVGFILLQRNRKYLGDDTPRGSKGAAWLGAMVFVTLFMTTFLVWYAITNGPRFFDSLMKSIGGS